MARFFVPYTQDTPAAIEVNGHRLLLVCVDEKGIRSDLASLGGDRVRELNLKSSQEQTAAFASLAESIKGGVVLTPPGVSVQTMLRSLENELPWIH